VNVFAALLRGVCDTQTGDRITFHLPMVPELPVSMLACARLGVIHSQVFGGFSGAACGDRAADSQSRVLVTMDGYYRNGELIDHKSKADEAVEAATARDQLVARPQIEMVGVGQQDLRADRFEIPMRDAFHRALSADRHERRRLDVAVRRRHHAATRAAVGVGNSEREHVVDS